MFGSLRNFFAWGGDRTVVNEIDNALSLLLLKWVRAAPETKFQAGCHMIEITRKILPDVDFGRNLYPQFQPLDRPWKHEVLKNFGRECLDNSKVAEAVDPALHIALGVAGQLLLLWGFSIGSQDFQVKRALGAVYAGHIRMINDFIQYALYLMVAGGITPNAEVAAALLPRE